MVKQRHYDSQLKKLYKYLVNIFEYIRNLGGGGALVPPPPDFKSRKIATARLLAILPNVRN
jgi:hypothetical protein